MIHYFDNNATTAMDGELAWLLATLHTQDYANPNATHALGVKARKLLEQARERVAECFCVEPDEIFFTSGATESINWILRSSLHFAGNRNRVVTTSIEHKAVLNTLKDLKNTTDLEFVQVEPERDGIVKPEKLLSKIDEKTFLISLMAVNNVTGAIQPFRDLSKTLRRKGVLYHVDAVQTIGKLPFLPGEVGCDFASFSAHKFHGPKGVGITYVRAKSSLKPLLTGGGQEKGMRSGTENVPAVVAASFALKKAYETMPEVTERLKTYRESIKLEVEKLGGLINSPDDSIVNTLNVSFEGIKSEVLANALSGEGVFVGISSACSARQSADRYVLASMGLGPARISSAIRISMSRFTNSEDVAILIEKLKKSVSLLKF